MGEQAIKWQMHCIIDIWAKTKTLDKVWTHSDKSGKRSQNHDGQLHYEDVDQVCGSYEKSIPGIIRKGIKDKTASVVVPIYGAIIPGILCTVLPAAGESQTKYYIS